MLRKKWFAVLFIALGAALCGVGCGGEGDGPLGPVDPPPPSVVYTIENAYDLTVPVGAELSDCDLSGIDFVRTTEGRAEYLEAQADDSSVNWSEKGVYPIFYVCGDVRVEKKVYVYDATLPTLNTGEALELTTSAEWQSFDAMQVSATDQHGLALNVLFDRVENGLLSSETPKLGFGENKLYYHAIDAVGNRVDGSRTVTVSASSEIVARVDDQTVEESVSIDLIAPGKGVSFSLNGLDILNDAFVQFFVQDVKVDEVSVSEENWSATNNVLLFEGEYLKGQVGQKSVVVSFSGGASYSYTMNVTDEEAPDYTLNGEVKSLYYQTKDGFTLPLMEKGENSVQNIDVSISLTRDGDPVEMTAEGAVTDPQEGDYTYTVTLSRNGAPIVGAGVEETFEVLSLGSNLVAEKHLNKWTAKGGTTWAYDSTEQAMKTSSANNFDHSVHWTASSLISDARELGYTKLVAVMKSAGGQNFYLAVGHGSTGNGMDGGRATVTTAGSYTYVTKKLADWTDNSRSDQTIALMAYMLAGQSAYDGYVKEIYFLRDTDITEEMYSTNLATKELLDAGFWHATAGYAEQASLEWDTQYSCFKLSQTQWTGLILDADVVAVAKEKGYTKLVVDVSNTGAGGTTFVFGLNNRKYSSGSMGWGEQTPYGARTTKTYTIESLENKLKNANASATYGNDGCIGIVQANGGYCRIWNIHFEK